MRTKTKAPRYPGGIALGSTALERAVGKASAPVRCVQKVREMYRIDA